MTFSRPDAGGRAGGGAGAPAAQPGAVQLRRGVRARARHYHRRHEVRVRLVDDELIVIDEILTPDSSRFWDVERLQARASRRRASTSSTCATGSRRPAGTKSRRRPSSRSTSCKARPSATRRRTGGLPAKRCARRSSPDSAHRRSDRWVRHFGGAPADGRGARIRPSCTTDAIRRPEASYICPKMSARAECATGLSLV